MLFNSFGFGVFFLLVFALYWTLRGTSRARFQLLLVASYVFYSFWSVHYLALILFSTVLDYWVGKRLGRTGDARRRKWLLTASLTGNLGVLATFKYFDFFSTEIAKLLGAFGVEAEPILLDVALPVGISFYTFQTLSYTIDVYRGTLPPERSFLRFALFVAFFPQLVAGPIVRAVEFLPQLDQPARLDPKRFESGLALVFWGLVKKVVIADYLGSALVDTHYYLPEAYGGWTALLSMYAYSFQIYGDFSGYSDVAIGVGRMLGFELPVNFLSPYKSTSWREFWRRWHVSFSTWFRDYLFQPLGGTRGSLPRIAFSLFFTMALVGLWHGAGWTYVVFGVLNGILILFDLLTKQGKPKTKAMFFVKWLITYHGCVWTMIMFRAPDMATAGGVFMSMFNEPHDIHISFWTYFALGFAAFTHFLHDDGKTWIKERFLALPPEVKGIAYACLLGLIMNAETMRKPFIYFQF